MSLRIKLADLSDEHKSFIRKHLLHKREENYTMKSRQSYGSQIEKPELQLFETNGEELWLPITYARGLLKLENFDETEFPMIDLTFTGTLLPRQDSVIVEATEQLENYNTTTLWLHPGFGKTVLGAYLSCYLKCKTIIIHTMSTLNKQWFTAFSSFTTAKIWVVGEKEIENPDVVICMDTRITKLSDDYLSQFGVLIIDEAHEWCSTQNRISKLMRFHPKYIIVESATIQKADSMEKVIYCIAGKHCVRRDYEKEFKAIIVHTNFEPEIKKTIHGTNMDLLRKDLARDNRRNNIIIDLVKQNKDYKILIVSWLVEHCEYLTKLLLDENVSSYYGNAKNYKDARIIIGTYKKVGTGFDEALACENWDGKRIDLVVMTILVKDTNFFEQVVGRGLRSEFPNFILLVDDNPTVKRHLSANKKWLNAHKCSIREINLINEYESEILDLNKS